MGTDIYLSWNKITKKEKKDQCCGWNIYSGNLGYLRASIGMQNENGLLRMVFEDKFWEGTADEDGYEFDFIGNWEKIQRLGFMYLVGVVSGKPINQFNQGHGEAIKKLLEEFNDEVQMGGNLHFVEAVGFLNSVFEFFRLGCTKQQEGKNPKVYISW